MTEVGCQQGSYAKRNEPLQLKGAGGHAGLSP